jgi:hypothetical protein
VHDTGLMSPQSQLLRRARAAGEFVQIERSIPQADLVIGYVVAVGTRWALVSVVSDGAPNGWVAVRVEDIVTVDQAAGGRFVQRGLASQAAWPAAAPSNALALSGSVQALVMSAASAFPVLTLYVERQDPACIIVGRPAGWAEGYLLWQEMNLSAAWDEGASSWDPAQITRLDVGGQYVDALNRVSDLRG